MVLPREVLGSLSGPKLWGDNADQTLLPSAIIYCAIKKGSIRAFGDSVESGNDSVTKPKCVYHRTV